MTIVSSCELIGTAEDAYATQRLQDTLLAFDCHCIAGDILHRLTEENSREVNRTIAIANTLAGVPYVIEALRQAYLKNKAEHYMKLAEDLMPEDYTQNNGKFGQPSTEVFRED